MENSPRTVSAKVSIATWKRVQSAVVSSGTRWKTVSDFHREAIERMLKEVESIAGGRPEAQRSHQRSDSNESEVEPTVDGVGTRIDKLGSDIAETQFDVPSADINKPSRARPTSDEISPSPDWQRCTDRMLRAVRQGSARRGWRLRTKKARDEDRGR